MLMGWGIGGAACLPATHVRLTAKAGLRSNPPVGSSAHPTAFCTASRPTADRAPAPQLLGWRAAGAGWQSKCSRAVQLTWG